MSIGKSLWVRLGLGVGLGLFVATAQAQTTYTWTQTAGGNRNWTDGVNWSGGSEPIPVSGDTVDFSTVNIAAATTLTLGADRTAEIWKFGDTGSAFVNWTVNSGNKIILAGATPTINVVPTATDYTVTLNCILGGSAGLKKDGAGILSLDPNKLVINTFTGPITLNGGKILGASLKTLGSGGDITFTGSTWITPPHSVTTTFAKTVTVNPGVTATFYMISQFYNMAFTGPLAGSGTVYLLGPGGGANGSLAFSSAVNAFTGKLEISSQGNASVPLTVNSLPDSANPIKFTGTSWPGDFVLGTGTATPLLFNSRQIELGGTTQGGNIRNNNATLSNTITINTDLLVSNTGNKTLTLGGSNTGANTFGGKIVNGTGATISLTKADAGKWILTGVNTYSGATTISGGTLEIGGSGSLNSGNYAATIANAGTLKFNSSANQILGGVISGTGVLIKDGVGTLSLTASNTYTGNTTNNVGTLSLGNGTNNSSLSDFSTLSVASGAVLNLNYLGSDKVFYLNLGGSPAAKGTWGATGSGASNINDTYFTGTGVIDNLAGDTTSLNIAYWDGGSADILTDGNAASAGGAGTWNTTLKNWDYGFTAHKVWANTTAEKAVFAGAENADRTVTVTENLNIKELSFETTGATGTRYKIDGGTLNFGAGGVIRTIDNRYDQTITSAITGSPAVYTKDFGAAAYLGLKFAPSSGTVTLGVVLNPDNTGNTDKAGINLGGSTTGNSVRVITYAGADQYGTVYVSGGEWTVGGITNGTLTISGGTLRLGTGVSALMYNVMTMTGGKLTGSPTMYSPDKRGTFYINNSATIAPGSNGVGTITFDWGTSGTPLAGSDDYSLWLKSGSRYEWEIGPDGVDTIHLTEGRLYADTGMVLKVLDAGGTPKATDQLPVFTYVAGVTRNLGTVTIDTSALLGGWSGTPTLVDNGTGTIYLTGLQAPSGGTVIILK